MSTLIVVLIILGFIAVRVATQAGVSAVTESLFDVMTRSRRDRRRLSPTFLTSLSPADAIDAARKAANGLAASGVQDHVGAAGVSIAFASGTWIDVTVATDPQGGTRVRVTPGRPRGEDATMADYRGALLAALRQRDPAARQK